MVTILCDVSEEEVASYFRDHCSGCTNISLRHRSGRADVRRRLVDSGALGLGTADEIDVVLVRSMCVFFVCASLMKLDVGAYTPPR